MSSDNIDFYTDPSVVGDPHPYFRELRQQCPVVHLPTHDVYAATTYAATVQVLRDPENYSSCNSVGGPFPGFSTPIDEAGNVSDFIDEHRAELPMSEYVVTLDPPEHRLQRSLVMRLLTPRRMRENEEYMRSLAEAKLDEILAAGKVEVLKGFGYQFALLVIADLLGVPDEDRDEFRQHLGGLPDLGDDATPVVLDPLSFLQERFGGYITDRRRSPRNDVLTQLAETTYTGGEVPEVDSVVRMATFLFAAGQDTTARLITAAMQIIAERPEVQAHLRGDASRIPNFVEEVLRYDGVVKTAGRTTRRAVNLQGVEIPAGAGVAIFPQAANRDPARFEAPDEFRPDRSNASDHLAFGRGIHACPGAPLARVEARVAIERFLARTSDISIDEAEHGPPGQRRWSHEPVYILHGLQELHLVLDPAGGQP